jgi:hypothetical protein
MSESTKSFIITQYGLSCFERTGDAAYAARTFNFWIFPQPPPALGVGVPEAVANRRFLCEAGSLAFLSEQVRWLGCVCVCVGGHAYILVPDVCLWVVEGMSHNPRLKTHKHIV